MKLLVIRHGESEADILNVHEGRADFELTPRGHGQAREMAGYVRRQFRVNRIYSSPLKRALATAGYLSEATGIPVETDKRLMEFNNGLIAGLSRPEADRRYPFVGRLPVHTSVYEQESTLDFRYRAEYMLSKLIAENAPDSTVAVIAHGGIINQLYRAFLRLPLENDVVFATGDTGIHLWDINDKRRIVRMSNYMGHLSAT